VVDQVGAGHLFKRRGAENPPHAHLSRTTYQEQIRQACDAAVDHFDRVINGHFRFHALFLVLAIGELSALILFLSSLLHRPMLAITLATFFLTAFSYFVLRLYYQAKKPEQLLIVRDNFILLAKQVIGYQEGIPEHYHALANGLSHLASQLQDREYTYHRPPLWLGSLNPSLEKMSCWTHWEEVHAMQELLLLAAIDEHLKLVRCEPTDLEVHAGLANSYVMLSSLYIDPRGLAGYDEDHWIPPGRCSEEMQETFRVVAERACQEFHIMSAFAPNDPWVHAQLAYSYRDLGMVEEEIHEFETIRLLCPDDRDSLFKLGVCYFKAGRNADGLRVYEALRYDAPKQAADLIRFYG
jgi:tetratricopeptide (TPR) repeat protein